MEQVLVRVASAQLKVQVVLEVVERDRKTAQKAPPLRSPTSVARPIRWPFLANDIAGQANPGVGARAFAGTRSVGLLLSDLHDRRPRLEGKPVEHA